MDDADVEVLIGARVPITFAIEGCPVTINNHDAAVEVRLVGNLDLHTSAEVRRALDVALGARRPISLILNGLDVVDNSGANVIVDLLARLTGSHQLASVVGLDADADRACRGTLTCGCDNVNSAVANARVFTTRNEHGCPGHPARSTGAVPTAGRRSDHAADATGRKLAHMPPHPPPVE